MARHTGLISSIIRAQAEAERQAVQQRNASIRAQTQAARTAIQAEKSFRQMQAANEKERARLYFQMKESEVALKNEQLEQTISQLSSLLVNTLSKKHFINFNTLKQPPQLPVFEPGALTVPLVPPVAQWYYPPQPTSVQKLLPGVNKKYQQEVGKAQERYNADFALYQQAEQDRQITLNNAWNEHNRLIEEIQNTAREQHSEIEKFQLEFNTGHLDAILNYFKLVLDFSVYPDGFPAKSKIAYVPESKQMVVEYDFPTFEIVPEIASYKYTKTRDEVKATPRKPIECKELYSSVIAQVTLRTIHELFSADYPKYLESIVFNGYVESIDKSTGRLTRTCLVTLRTTYDVFSQLDLLKVDPVICLRGLNAEISKSPAEFVPVRPVLDFNMVDPRFIEETDVISGLDQRPNLMELTPNEFEALIANLFGKMGLETKLTQASRDGGVDCIAFDTRPILGGKIVIQAKRYKNTVGVSAVRDLYGTVHNEGASKGILITTSGYGKAAFDFAKGKPLELFSGSNLLYMLKEHAGIEAKIVMPEDWEDTVID